MIKTLRKKFVITTLSMIGLVLLIVFICVFVSQYNMLKLRSEATLRMAVAGNSRNFEPKFNIDQRRWQKEFSVSPMFILTVNANGEIIDSYLGVVEEDSEVFEKALAAALNAKSDGGMLSAYELRYQKRQTEDGNTIVGFISISDDLVTLRRQIIMLVLGWLGGMGAFLVISIFLSKIIVRPVEKAWVQQRRFIADASHELKTPLTVILANIGILKKHRSEMIKDQFKWVDSSEEEAVRMKKLVDDMLFLAKADDMRTPEIMGEVNLSDAVWSSLLPFESVAFENGLTLDSDIESDIKCIGNEGQLKQLAAILLDNACKYTQKSGNIKTTLTQTQDAVCLKVQNTGDPIKADNLPHLFDRFYRADQARTQGGYGLGLSIAKTITDAHHGKISVDSAEEDGTTFTVILPKGNDNERKNKRN